MRRIRAYVIQLCFVVVAYYAAAHIGYAFRFSGPVASIVWLPAGVGIAALYLLGPRLWPGVVIGDLLVNNYSTLPLGSAIGQSVGNLLEVLIAALLLRRFASRYTLLGSISGFGGLLLAVMAGTLVSATVGSVSAVLGNVVGVGSLWRVWGTWWLGDLCGSLIVVPLALAWLPPPSRRWFDGRRVELAPVLAALVGLSVLGWQTSHPMSFLALPALTWAALRFGPRGGTLAIAIGAALTVWATTHYIGPFAFRSVSRSVFDTQVYLVVSAVATLCVAALARERERLAEGLRASRARIVTATDVERRRIERNIHDGAQQRLVALCAQLALAEDSARTRPLTAPEAFASARGELQLAVEELRELCTGSVLWRSAGSASRAPSGWRRPARASPSSSGSCPRTGLTRPPSRPRTTWRSKRSPTRSDTPSPRRSGSPHAERRAGCISRWPTTGSAERLSGLGAGCRGCGIGWRRSAARSRSRAQRDGGPASPQRSRPEWWLTPASPGAGVRRRRETRAPPSHAG